MQAAEKAGQWTVRTVCGLCADCADCVAMGSVGCAGSVGIEKEWAMGIVDGLGSGRPEIGSGSEEERRSRGNN